MFSPPIFKFLGYNPDLGKLCAGPRIANAEDGKVQVGPCNEDLVHLPPSMIDIAQVNSKFGKFKKSYVTYYTLTLKIVCLFPKFSWKETKKVEQEMKFLL